MTPWAPTHSAVPDDGAQVVGIGNPVQQNQEGRFAPLLGQGQHVLHRGVLIRRGKGQQPLMMGGDGIQAGLVHLLDGHMGFPGHVHDFPGGAGEVAPLHQQLFNVPASLQGLRMGLRPESRFSLGWHSATGAGGTGGTGRRCSKSR